MNIKGWQFEKLNPGNRPVRDGLDVFERWVAKRDGFRCTLELLGDRESGWATRWRCQMKDQEAECEDCGAFTGVVALGSSSPLDDKRSFSAEDAFCNALENAGLQNIRQAKFFRIIGTGAGQLAPA